MSLVVTPVLAGSGYEYLTRQIASGREDWLPGTGDAGVEYYASGDVGGERPGVWLGRQAQEWGLAGEPVTAVQMRLLIGAGTHPVTGEPLGRRHPVIRTIEERLAEVDACADELTPEEVEEEKARIRAGGERAARGGFDCTFSPPKSVSVLWAAASPDLAEAVFAAHRDAVTTALTRLEADACLTRAGVGGVRQIDGGGFAVMAFEHRTSREQDPQIHTHAVIANRVLGSDGRWRTVDSRAVYRASTAAAGTYAATLWRNLAVLGLRVEPVGGPEKLEIAGVPPELLSVFSTRRLQIEAALGGRLDELTGVTRRRAAQVASLATRRKKLDEPRASNQLRADWQERMRAAGHDPAAVWDAARVAAGGTVVPGWTPAMVDTAITAMEDDPRVTVPAAAARVLGRDLTAADADAVRVLRRVADAAVEARTVRAAVVMLEQERGQWTRANAANAIARILALHPHLADLDVDATVAAVTARLLADPQVVALTPVDAWVVPVGLRRASGESVYSRAGETVYSTVRVLERLEGEVLAAAVTPGAVTYTPGQVDDAVTALAVVDAGEVPVSVEQQAAVEQVLGRDSRVRALLGAAGAGKTSTLRVVTTAAQERGLCVVGLAPSQVAANVLRDATGMVTANMAAFTSLSPSGAAARAAVRPGTLVVIDEAGMATTSGLHRVVTQVLAAGGDVLLVGDPDQLGAVGAGGMLATVARVTSAPTLLEVRRFTADWEAAASLRLRDGDVSAVAEYARRGRVASGSLEDLLARFTTATAADLLAGRDAILIAGSNEVAASAAGGVRDLLVRAGRVDDRVTVALADGTRAGAGDVVVTRVNDHAREIANRDTWTVTAVTTDGGLRVQRTSCPSDRDTGHVTGHGRRGDGDGGDTDSRVRVLRPGYVRAHVQLAYAGTVHAAQGRTVHAGRVLVGEHDDRHLLYVGATRGRDRNEIGAITAPSVEALVGWVETKTPDQLLAEVVTRSGNTITATDARLDQHEQATSIARLVAVHRDLATLALTGTGTGTGDIAEPGQGITGWVRDVDPDAAARLAGDPAMPALVTAVAAAARRGIDPHALVTAAARVRPLDDAQDVAALLQWRITRLAGLLTAPVSVPRDIDDPTAWLPALLGPPPPDGSGLADTAVQVAAAAADRVTVLGQRAATERPGWVAALGPSPGPTMPGYLAQDWYTRAGVIAAYRELVGRTEPDPIGPPPRDPDTRRAWAAADAALAGAHLPGRVWRATPATLRGLQELATQVEADRPVWVADHLATASMTEAAAHLRVAETRVTTATTASASGGEQPTAAAVRDLADAETALAQATGERVALETADAAARAYGAAHRDTLTAGRWATYLLRHRDPGHRAVPDVAAARHLITQNSHVSEGLVTIPAIQASGSPVLVVAGGSIPTRPVRVAPRNESGTHSTVAVGTGGDITRKDARRVGRRGTGSLTCPPAPDEAAPADPTDSSDEAKRNASLTDLLIAQDRSETAQSAPTPDGQRKARWI